MTATAEQQSEALSRAETNQSLLNYPAIFEGFIEKGVPESEIIPRVNVFTYNAWKAKGRQVLKGEHGVKVVTWIDCKPKDIDPDTGEPKKYKRAKSATVFHISQTEPANNKPGSRRRPRRFDNADHRRSHYDPTGFYTADGTCIGRQNPKGRCADAPCCGCCT